MITATECATESTQARLVYALRATERIADGCLISMAPSMDGCKFTYRVTSCVVLLAFYGSFLKQSTEGNSQRAAYV